jgi:IS605 OrfB family transposase
VKLTLQTQLLPDPEQAQRLATTMEAFNAAADWLAGEAFKLQSANKVKLQQLYYRRLRAEFNLSAQKVRGSPQKKAAKQKRSGKRPKNARRKLKDLSGRERRFKADTNHTISKRIVERATDTGRGIGLENLTGIRDRTRFRHEQRDKMSKWSFGELRGFIEYKAKLVGVPVIPVDPRNTSRTCPERGHIDKGNRLVRGIFLCRECGHFDHADVVGAINIACGRQSRLAGSRGTASG